MYICMAAALLCGCHRATQTTTIPTIYRGADLGWLSEMEHDSMLFHNEAGEAMDCIELLQTSGMNAVRLRVWVNHSTGWSNLPDVLGLARRVQAVGLPLMIDLHYSDFFADPQRQDIPTAWTDLNLDEMCIAIGAHTTEVLETLRNEGITPQWVQIGNETTYGMLWPMGALCRDRVNEDALRPELELSRDLPACWQQYARLSNAGYEAAKMVFPDITCIIHVDNAFIPRVNWFARFQAAGGKWDMIGLSHYPFTQDSIAPLNMNARAAENIAHLYQTYHTPVMVVEIGTASWMPDSATVVMRDFRERTDTLEGYVGVFYWEPEVYGNWRPAEYIPLGWGSYGMGAMTEEGQMSEALQVLYAE